jgi:beta-lactamase regulating signal transducer with metallopeptidase domain
MHEYLARPFYYAGVHFYYASLVWCGAWILTSTIRASATSKYWMWVATLLNFSLPLGAVLDKSLARHLLWARPLGVIGEAGLRIADNAALVGTVWLLGALFMAARLYLRVRAGRRNADAGQSKNQSKNGFCIEGIHVRFASSWDTPVVDGVLRPEICLPLGIQRLLTKSELNAVVLHELTHARRRDNLIWLLQEIALCLLWFHPLVWATGARLAFYRELSCDEAVIHSGHGRKLVSALAKLANPDQPRMLQATATSFMSQRLARLAEARPLRTSRLASALLTIAFSALLAAGAFATVSHTACCFVGK